jgi:hypothetical protein
MADKEKVKTVGESQFDENYKTDQERRSSPRRFSSDRRLWERRKSYLIKILVPILGAVVFGGILAWAVYVTHTTYTISANYEKSFIQHVADQIRRDVTVDHKFELFSSDYHNQINRLRDEVNTDQREIRSALNKIYDLLLRHEQKRAGREGPEELMQEDTGTE